MSRIDEITQACVRQILDSWAGWSQGAEMSASAQQDPGVHDDEMHAALWHVVKAAVEQAACELLQLQWIKTREMDGHCAHRERINS